MAKVPAYHTDFGEHPAEYRDVYHDHDDCPDGRLILPHHRSSGTGGKPQCKKCAELTRRPVDEGIRRNILTLLEQHRIMTIATLRPDGWPQATTWVTPMMGSRFTFSVVRIAKRRQTSRETIGCH